MSYGKYAEWGGCMMLPEVWQDRARSNKSTRMWKAMRILTAVSKQCESSKAIRILKSNADPQKQLNLLRAVQILKAMRMSRQSKRPSKAILKATRP